MEQTIEMEKVVTYEPTVSHRYKTVLVDIKEEYNGYGYVKVVTFRGLSLCKNDEEVIDSSTKFKCTYAKKVTMFDNIPFGSVISLCAKPILTIINDEHEELRLNRPSRIEIEEEGYFGSFKPYIKLPMVDLDCYTPVAVQLREMGIELDDLNEEQQLKVYTLEEWRRNNKTRKPPVRYKGNLSKGLDFKAKVSSFYATDYKVKIKK